MSRPRVLSNEARRLKITLRGAVQGVGFRPFIYRLATELGVKGWVRNSSQGVLIEAEDQRETLEAFLLRIERDKPPRAFIQSLEYSYLDPVGCEGFEIRPSDASGAKKALVLPDIATCADCVREILNPADRRYLYPFTNCTHCGPRFSILEALPYDRSNTTMKRFRMCGDCRGEYEDPLNRRFHAQPNACPGCGPRLELWDCEGRRQAAHHEALRRAAQAIRRGATVAVKGLGGFHLIVDARDNEAVERLRRRKQRQEKPFALMVPALEGVQALCDVSELEERLLCSPESPIVLLRRRSHSGLAPSVAPRTPCLGVLLPYTPLHHLLMAELGFPVVATSGNLSDEPICTDEREALGRLGSVADLFLVHDRPIVRHVDDSIVRVMMGRELVLRRARGYAPLPVSLKEPAGALLAVGAHLKNTVALSKEREVFVSQHIGDLETTQALEAFRRVILNLEDLYEIRPSAIVCDAHPDYVSTRFAKQNGVSVIPIQHHVAHVMSCMAENELEPPVLGIAWDGTGYGLDGTIWGGEFFRISETGFERVAHFRTFPLPGGAKAVREPRRTAVGLLYELFGESLFAMKGLEPLRAFSNQQLEILRTMLRKRLQSPDTSSVGRLFDAVAALLGLRQYNRFEGQAAMDLEFALDAVETDETYPLRISEAGGVASAVVVDWGPMVREVLEDRRSGVSAGTISARFHNTLADGIVHVAQQVGEGRVVLTGGCFQNKYLTERAVRRLTEEGFRPYWHQRIPPNDGGIALGQIVAASRWKPKGG